jgi:hypothetical protein
MLILVVFRVAYAECRHAERHCTDCRGARQICFEAFSSPGKSAVFECCFATERLKGQPERVESSNFVRNNGAQKKLFVAQKKFETKKKIMITILTY